MLDSNELYKSISQADSIDRLLNELSASIVRFGLEIPSVLFVEALIPFSGLGAHFLTFSSPFLEVVLPAEKIDTIRNLLADRQNLEKLILLIEKSK